MYQRPAAKNIRRLIDYYNVAQAVDKCHTVCGIGKKSRPPTSGKRDKALHVYTREKESKGGYPIKQIHKQEPHYEKVERMS